jgi:hypothetical protein
LQHNNDRIVIEQHARLNAYEEQATLTPREMERLRHENAILCHGTFQSMDRDLELHVAYRHLSEAEHRWNYTRQQLDSACEVVDTRTHAIVHLENAIETEDLELKERVAMIATLEQQLQVLQLQTPPTPEVPATSDAVSDVDEDLVM